MSWSLFRWAWQLDGPLHVGMPPAGSLNRTRLYVPARALWGALTAELARQEAEQGKEPQYQAVGENLQRNYRFTYLFPAERNRERWQAWLPTYREALGLAWSREDKFEAAVGDRQFRRRLLSTRPGTAIDATTDAADDGSLRETECVETRWQSALDHASSPVAMVGYVSIRSPKTKDELWPEQHRLDGVDTIFVGGDTRYGLGCLRRVAFDLVERKEVFGASATLDADSPQIETASVWAHAHDGSSIRGALELLGGWDRGAIRSLDDAEPLWQPGSFAANSLRWSIEADGLWRPEGRSNVRDLAPREGRNDR